jgi:amino acid adenylation domain-containing protein
MTTQPLLSQLIGLSPEQRRAVLDRMRQRGAGSSSIPRLADRATGGASPASFTQDRLWFLWQLAPGSTSYHVAWCYEVAGGLNVDRLAAAVDALIERHEVLRTTLHEQDGQIVQRVCPPWRCGLTTVPATSSENAIELATAAARELFDLSAGPLLRARAWELAPDRHVVGFTTHHVIMDGWSLDIFERELWALYDAGGDAAAAALPEVAVQYADYASWHRVLVAGQADADLDYWREALDGATPACPVPDHTGSDHAGFSGAEAVVTVPASELDWLTTTRAAAGTDFVALFAIWCLFLARCTGRRDLTVGTPVSSRSHADTASLIGCFVNTVALRVRVDPGTDFPGYLGTVRAAVLDAIAHQEIPFDHVVRAVAPHRTAASNPLYTTLFTYTPAADASWHNRTLNNGLTLTALPVDAGGSLLDLTLTSTRTPEGLLLRLEYNTDLYDPATIDGYLNSLTSLIATVSHDPGARLHALLEPTARERQLLTSWNNAAAAPSSTVPLHDLIAAQAAATPESIAIEAQDTCLTYRELDAAAGRLASRLRRAGVRGGDIVGVRLPPTATAITAVLATWKAGAAFLPLDPDLPPARITALIDDARPTLLITEAPTPRPDLDYLLTRLPSGHDYDHDEGANDGNGLPAVGPDHLAYLMYTSGSTGQPKAVMIHHGALSNHATAQVLPWTNLAEGDNSEQLRVATGTSAFIADFFIIQLATLAGGHTLVVLTPDQRQDPGYLVALAADRARAVTAIECTTSQLQLYVEAGLLDAPHPPRLIAFGGETCPADLRAALCAHPATASFNSYGPAETTVEVTIGAIAECPVPLIGRPFGNALIRILDDQQRPVPPGTPGELCIAGPGVGYGYLGRPAQTAAVFIPDPYGPPGRRIYRTGDLARYTHDGQLEFHGRNDHQIKILGQRVEPGEVEAALRDHPDITAAAVTHHKAASGIQLTAHLIAADDTTPDPGTIRTWLAQRLPAAAVPANIRFTTGFPFTTGGKLDRKALTDLALDPDLSRVPVAPPSTPAEHQIAAIWAELLGHDPGSLGIHDDFFALGGHSLLAARLALRLSAELNTDIPLHQVFTHPTITGQATWIGDHPDTPAAPPIPRQARATGTEVPASYGQERLWFWWQLAPHTASYHVSWAYQTTSLDVTALGAAVDAMIERHEIFRTTLHDHGGQLAQHIRPPWHCHLTVTPASLAEAAAAADTAAAELFDLSQGPLLRVRAWHTGPDTHLLLFTAHHVVIDGWSLKIFEQELWALYAARGDAAAASLTGPAIQYADYASWHRELTATTADDDVTWWAGTLEGAIPTSPVPDHAAPDRTDFSGGHAVATADPAAIAWLTATRNAAATTDFVVLLALYCIFLARHSGRRDLTVGTLVSGRNHPDTAGLIGYLVNTLALRVRVDPAATFPDHVAQVRQVVLNAFAHQEIPFEQVVRAVAPERTTARDPLFTSLFHHDIATVATARTLPGGLTLTRHPAGDKGATQFDLSLSTARVADSLFLQLDYSTALYEPTTIDGYLDSLTDLLAVLAADPGTRVGRLLR